MVEKQKRLDDIFKRLDDIFKQLDDIFKQLDDIFKRLDGIFKRLNGICYTSSQKDQVTEQQVNPVYCIFVVFSSKFILLSRENDQFAIRARLRVAGHLCASPHNGGIPRSAFPNDTTSKLAGLFSILSVYC